MSSKELWDLFAKIAAFLIFVIVVAAISVLAFKQSSAQPRLPLVDAATPQKPSAQPDLLVSICPRGDLNEPKIPRRTIA